MDLELRTIGEDELGEFLRGVTTGFGMTTADENDEYPVHLLPADRRLVVRDGDTFVATAGAFPFRLTVPGGALYGVVFAVFLLAGIDELSRRAQIAPVAEASSG